MAPEQILGHALSPATDLFAFGVVLFEMLCGQLPFAGHGATRQTALRRLSQKALPPSQLRPEVGPALDRLVASCLMERPEERCANTEQALSMLEDAVTPYRPSAIYPTVRSCGARGDAVEASGIAELPRVV
jgi:serine/threonine-protein kinase